MPKVYSAKEREVIVSNLRSHAAQCLSAYGIKKTTIDEIVRRARIPKGTFYLFYQSKEMLIFEVIMQWHDSLQEELLLSIPESPQPITVDTLTYALLVVYQKVESIGLAAILSNGEMEMLMHKLPEEIIAELLTHDDDLVERMLKSIPTAKGKDAKVFSAAFRGVFFMLLFRQEIGEDFDNALQLSIRGLVLQLLEGNSDD